MSVFRAAKILTIPHGFNGAHGLWVYSDSTPRTPPSSVSLRFVSCDNPCLILFIRHNVRGHAQPRAPVH